VRATADERSFARSLVCAPAACVGRVRGRVDLAATALGLGSTGLTFFDDEVTRSLEPAAQGRQVMYLVAIGQRA